MPASVDPVARERSNQRRRDPLALALSEVGLEEWWDSSFDDDERSVVGKRCTGNYPEPLDFRSIQGNASQLLFAIAGRLRKTNPEEGPAYSKIETEAIEQWQSLRDPSIQDPSRGIVDGFHYTAYLPFIRSLKQGARHTEVVDICLRLIDAAEAESKAEQWGAAPPAYYHEVALAARRSNQPAIEIEVLKRYLASKGRKHPDYVEKFERRLEKLGVL